VESTVVERIQRMENRDSGESTLKSTAPSSKGAYHLSDGLASPKALDIKPQQKDDTALEFHTAPLSQRLASPDAKPVSALCLRLMPHPGLSQTRIYMPKDGILRQ
jgi:hypothetical protein